MNESISDAILDSGEESILRAYAGLSITAGGVSLQRSELPQSLTFDELKKKIVLATEASSDSEYIYGPNNWDINEIVKNLSIDPDLYEQLINAKIVLATEASSDSEYIYGPAKYIMLVDPEKQSTDITIDGTPIDLSGKTTKEIMEILGLDINGEADDSFRKGSLPLPSDVTTVPIFNEEGTVVAYRFSSPRTNEVIASLPKGSINLNEEYLAARDELRAKNGKEPTCAEVFSYMVEQAKNGDAASDYTNTASISLNNVTYVANPDSNLPDHLICTVKSEEIPLSIEDYESETSNSKEDSSDKKLSTYELIKADLQSRASETVEYFKIKDSATCYAIIEEAAKNGGKIRLVPGISDSIDRLIESFSNSFSALIQGDPNYSLTVSISQTNVAYNLAGGATGFNQSISVYNTTGALFGTISLNVTASIFGVDCTLTLNNGDLSLSVGGNTLQETVPTYFNGTFAGGSSAIFAKQSGNTVDFYADGSSWGSSLTLGSGWDALGAGDFDGDGKDDILRINDDGYVVAELSNGSGSFTPQVLNMKGVGWCMAGIGDFNGNGKDDVLLINPTGASMTTGLVGYWESGSTWTLIGGSELEWQIVATGDFNADGKCDTLWRNSFIGELDGRTYNAYYTWITGEPLNGSHWRKVEAALANVWDFLCSGDFNGDGTDDVALINGSGEIGVWGIDNGYLDSWSILNAVNNPDEWTFGGVGDFDADGWDDIAWCNNSTNSVNYWSTYNIQIDPDNNNGNNWKTIGTIA